MPRSQRRWQSDSDHLELNLTPLLDVVLQLITFFMMLVHFGTQIEAAETEVRLPVAPAALPAAGLGDDQLVVTINAAGDLMVDGRTLEPEQADRWWANQADRRLAGAEAIGSSATELPTQVVVRADRNATYGAVRSTLSTAQRVGFARFTLVVLRPEDR